MSTSELELVIFRSLMLGFDKLSSTSQTVGSFTNLQAFNGLRKCGIAMFKWMSKGGKDKGQYMTR
jgi:hypothetical protein